LEKALY